MKVQYNTKLFVISISIFLQTFKDMKKGKLSITTNVLVKSLYYPLLYPNNFHILLIASILKKKEKKKKEKTE